MFLKNQYGELYGAKLDDFRRLSSVKKTTFNQMIAVLLKACCIVNFRVIMGYPCNP